MYDNVRVLKGSILDDQMIKILNNEEVDFVFSSAVLEQMNNYIDLLFHNIFQINCKNFLFYEEWLEANSNIAHYKTLVEADYFRLSTTYLNQFEFLKDIQFEIPAIQPSWLQYGVLFCEK